MLSTKMESESQVQILDKPVCIFRESLKSTLMGKTMRDIVI